MILSFHPIIEADENILCAGRAPNEMDLAAIRRAAAVILPQGCSEALYRMARANCAHIFPNMDIRFDYPGKRRQILLFRELGLPHPASELYDDSADFAQRPDVIALPAVIKLDWGGQGTTVFKIADSRDLDAVLERLRANERTGQKGFLFQQYIPSDNRCLRVTVIGRRLDSYWRTQPATDRFGTSMTAGAVIDHHADAHLQAAACAQTREICRRSGLQLGGFDFIFDTRALEQGRIEPLVLEINYFFGRTGLGGSERYYRLFEQAVAQWLATLALAREPHGRLGQI
ncbi:MAG: hypothetical protein VR64_15410 [Desulfatitalea sp. BRH_c12]|nr:MAG: hypothetical protein VR64_15410 [Desulfatitalea sp. BRH_c12]